MPVEKVHLSKDTFTAEAQFTGDVWHEKIETDGDTGRLRADPLRRRRPAERLLGGVSGP